MEGLSCCNICYQEELVDKQVKRLPCKHIVCLKCFPRLIKKECPYCRTPFGSETEIKKGENILIENYIQNNYIYQNYYYPPRNIINRNEESTSRSLPNIDAFDFYENSRVGRRIKRREKNIAKNSKNKNSGPRERKKDTHYVRPNEYEDIFEMDDI